jgi:BTB/POZ domain
MNQHPQKKHGATTSSQTHFECDQCRGLLSDVASAAEVPLDEDAAAVRLLISSIYDTNIPVSWSTVEPLLELARKYDVEDTRLSCERFLMAAVMNTTNVPRFMALSCTFGLGAVVQRCQDFIAADGNFEAIVQ